MSTESYELQFEAEHGTRLHRYFIGVSIRTEDTFLWWSAEHRSWMTLAEAREKAKHGFYSWAPCRTLKAFQRHLRTHGPSLREHGPCEVTLLNRFKGHSVSCRL